MNKLKNPYGYPECCVRFFWGKWGKLPMKARYQYANEVGAYTGFIPCPKCKPAVSSALKALKSEIKLLFAGGLK
jgi:hypothetical protein